MGSRLLCNYVAPFWPCLSSLGSPSRGHATRTTPWEPRTYKPCAFCLHLGLFSGRRQWLLPGFRWHLKPRFQAINRPTTTHVLFIYANVNRVVKNFVFLPLVALIELAEWSIQEIRLPHNIVVSGNEPLIPTQIIFLVHWTHHQTVRTCMLETSTSPEMQDNYTPSQWFPAPARRINHCYR
jgi:hypothetical protein